MAKRSRRTPHQERTAKGRIEELAVWEMLRKLGYDVLDLDHPSHADSIINHVVDAEAKYSGFGTTGGSGGLGYQYRLVNHRYQYPFEQHVLILRAEYPVGTDERAHFVIPGCVVEPERTMLTISCRDLENYRGRWAQFLEAWELLDQIIAYQEKLADNMPNNGG